MSVLAFNFSLNSGHFSTTHADTGVWKPTDGQRYTPLFDLKEEPLTSETPDSSVLFALKQQTEKDSARLNPLTQSDRVKTKTWIDKFNESKINPQLAVNMLSKHEVWGFKEAKVDIPYLGFFNEQFDEEEIKNFSLSFNCLSNRHKVSNPIPVNQMELESVHNDKTKSNYILVFKRGWFSQYDTKKLLGHWDTRKLYVSLSETEIEQFLEQIKPKKMCVIL